MWRVTSDKVSNTVYRGAEPVAQCASMRWAARIVAAMNAAEAKPRGAEACADCRRPIDLLALSEHGWTSEGLPMGASATCLECRISFCIACARKHFGEMQPHGPPAVEPARKAECGTCGGSGKVREIDRGGEMVTENCPDCGGR